MGSQIGHWYWWARVLASTAVLAAVVGYLAGVAFDALTR